jgi:two-component system, response regulator FlrC
MELTFLNIREIESGMEFVLVWKVLDCCGVFMFRVLVVDDEKNVLTTLSIGLKRHDYVVSQAKSGPEALKLLEEQPFDFVVSDIRMLPMDGYTLAALIRNRHPHIGIVLMSAYAFEEREERLKALGLPWLTKPFDVTDLVGIIEDEKNKKELEAGRF